MTAGGDDPWAVTPKRADPKQPLAKLDAKQWLSRMAGALVDAAVTGGRIPLDLFIAIGDALQRKAIAENFKPGPGLKITASEGAPLRPADEKAYLDMVRREMARSPSFAALMLEINADRDHPVEVILGRHQPGVFVDGFDSMGPYGALTPGQQEVDLADFARIPVNPPADYPNASTQGEILAHAMAEARQGALGLGYDDAHAVGIKAQNLYRDERGQSGHRRLPPDDPSGRNSVGNIDFFYDNHYSETWEKSATDDVLRIDRFQAK